MGLTLPKLDEEEILARRQQYDGTLRYESHKNTVCCDTHLQRRCYVAKSWFTTAERWGRDACVWRIEYILLPKQSRVDLSLWSYCRERWRRPFSMFDRIHYLCHALFCIVEKKKKGQGRNWNTLNFIQWRDIPSGNWITEVTTAHGEHAHC